MPEDYKTLFGSSDFFGFPYIDLKHSSETALPHGVTIDNLEEKQLEAFEAVLVQPETKRKQTVFLKHLAKPKQQLTVELTDKDRLNGNIISFLRPTRGEAIAMTLKAAVGVSGVIYLVELPPDEMTDTTAVADFKDKPAVFLDIQVEGDATLKVVYLHPIYFTDSDKQPAAPEVAATVLYNAAVEQGGTLNWTAINLADSVVERGLVTLQGRYAVADIGNAAFVASGIEQTYQANIRCQKPYGIAKVKHHGVVADNGIGSFFSIADIAKGAVQTNVREDNRVLTLGDKARAYTDPTLLIEEYDVRASHAATVAQLDLDILFYLQSRGLSEEQTKKIITIGYLAPLLARIEQDDVRRQLHAVLTERVGRGDEAR